MRRKRRTILPAGRAARQPIRVRGTSGPRSRPILLRCSHYSATLQGVKGFYGESAATKTRETPVWDVFSHKDTKTQRNLLCLYPFVSLCGTFFSHKDTKTQTHKEILYVLCVSVWDIFSHKDTKTQRNLLCLYPFVSSRPRVGHFPHTKTPRHKDTKKPSVFFVSPCGTFSHTKTPRHGEGFRVPGSSAPCQHDSGRWR